MSMSNSLILNLKLIRLNQFKNWLDRLTERKDLLYYDHILYFRQEIIQLTDNIGQVKTSQLLCLSQTKLSHLLKILKLLPTNKEKLLGHPLLTTNKNIQFTNIVDYIDWTRTYND